MPDSSEPSPERITIDDLLQRLFPPQSENENRRILMPDALRAVLPPLTAQQEHGFDALVYARFIDLSTGIVFYPTGFDGKDGLGGFMIAESVWWNTFSLAALTQLGTVRRDTDFPPQTMRSVLHELGL